MTDKAPGEGNYTDKEHGEGNYKASKEFQKEQHEFARSGEVEDKARKAAEALEGDEAEELEKARKSTAAKGQRS